MEQNVLVIAGQMLIACAILFEMCAERCEWSSDPLYIQRRLNTWRADAVNFPGNVEAGPSVVAEIPICCTRGAVLTWNTAQFPQLGACWCSYFLEMIQAVSCDHIVLLWCQMCFSTDLYV